MLSPERPSFEQLFLAIEKLDDLIAGKATIADALTSGLAFILNQVRRPAGALYAAGTESGSTFGWVQVSAPPTLVRQLLDPLSVIQQLAHQVITTGEPVSGDYIPDMGSVLPLIANDQSQGVILVAGEPCSPEEIEYLTALSRPLARAIYHDRLLRNQATLEQDLAALKLLAESLTTYTDSNDLQLWILKGIQELFKSEAVSLILLDDDDPQIAIKKVIIDQAEWSQRTNLQLTDSLVLDCIRSEAPLYAEKAATFPAYNPEIDGVDGIQIRTVLCAPLISNGQVLGAIEIINSPHHPLTRYDMGLLASMAKWLSSSIFSLHLIQQLKVINADLEANRWELLHSRNTLRALFDSIPASIYIIDRKYNLIAINVSRAARINSRPNQLVGKKCYETLFQRDDPCAGCRVAETLRNGQPITRTDRQWLSNDQPVEWEISSFAIQDNASMPIQAILLEQDVTEKRRLEANLIQSEKLAAVGQLAAGVAHEINNPLAAVIANAQLLRRDLPVDADDALESVKLIELAGLRASQVVRNLLGFARKEQYDFSPTDLNETIQNALTLLQHEFVSRPIELHSDLEENMPRVRASRDHLQGVWINLIVNAMDAIESGSGQISITSHFVVNEFRVTIHDNGRGIPPEKVQRIFEPFYTTKASGRGTGLGLSVCHRIIKQHGGYIQVESRVGVGTKFTVVLPADGRL